MRGTIDLRNQAKQYDSFSYYKKASEYFDQDDYPWEKAYTGRKRFPVEALSSYNKLRFDNTI